ncbi:hypothetical protein [Arthrobacter mangrovi]|uniref:Nucleotidyltransferase n=1 Tax=Arthrobacter mangrovi TaxID=2966350 RepID=A0ABQ5MTB4_9MICC|nr:hypothetical protein [Arthrobacter mangrovi]GLB67215.1 hypothetical protein AHIS1636_16540 [Arthrobacter mangrovi]
MAAILEQAQQRTQGEPVEVRFTPRGRPLAVRWRGRLWPVVAEPVHEVGQPDGTGSMDDADVVVDTPAVKAECWRLQVQASSASPLHTLEVRRQPGRNEWLLRDVSGE